jgi:hypothetical protein
MPDMFVSLVAGTPNKSKTTGGERLEHAPGLTPQTKDGIWNERAAAYAGPNEFVYTSALNAIIMSTPTQAELNAVITMLGATGQVTVDLNAVVAAVGVLSAELNAIISGAVTASLDAVVETTTTLVELKTKLNAVVKESFPDLISYWNMDNNFKDLKDGNDGTPNSVGVTFSTVPQGKIQESAIFNGFAKFDVGVSANLDLGEMTFACWFQVDDLLANYTIVSRENAGSSNYRLWIANTTGAINLQCGPVLFTPGNMISADTWRLIVFTRDALDIVTLYLNGGQIGAPVYGGPLTLRPEAHTILGARELFAEPLKGRIDEAGIWGRCLTSNEVIDLWNLGAGRTYPF